MKEDDTPFEIDDIRSRRKIYRIIRGNPGVHFRSLERETGFASGTLQYHLREMTKKEIITEAKEEHYTRYFIRDQPISMKDKLILSYLRKELPRGILLFLLENPGSENRDFTRHFTVSSATISYHLKRFSKDDLIRSTGDTRMQRYSIKEPDRVFELILAFRSSFVDRIVDTLIESWTQ